MSQFVETANSITWEAGSNLPTLYRIHMNKVLTPSILGAFNSLFGGQRARPKLSPHFIALHLPFFNGLDDSPKCGKLGALVGFYSNNVTCKYQQYVPIHYQ